jgi:hypothetical protein
MENEKVITLNEFKIVSEEIKSQIKKVVEVMEHLFSQVDKKFEHIDKRMDRQDNRMMSLTEQIALLHEGQTAIKYELRESLKDKVSYKDFNRLENRVDRLERKTI